MKMLRGYLKESRRPIYSAALVVPFLVVYHAGTVILGTTYINGADALIIRILRLLSVHSMFASALVLAVSFIIWQLRKGAGWKIRGTVLFSYFLESIVYAVILLFAFSLLNIHLPLALTGGGRPFSDLVLYCGAGIYEEFLFRFVLFGSLMIIFHRLFPRNRVSATVTAALLGALLFAAFHYIGPAGDMFSFGSFTQRTLGGLYFTALFVKRGFGVTAASHAIYNIFIRLVLW
jgi:hypothetical protein